MLGARAALCTEGISEAALEEVTMLNGPRLTMGTAFVVVGRKEAGTPTADGLS